MKCIQNSLGDLAPRYPIEQLCTPAQALWIDIETTGLHAKSSSLYLIGCIYLDTQEQPACWHTIQWFAQNYDEEEALLREFVRFAADYRYLIHFNGNQFDIPYLTQKLEQYGISFSFDKMEGIDIYRRLAPYKEFLKLPNCKQKTIEGFLHTEREDVYTGGELIDIYHEYVLSHDDEKEHFLLLHNEEDIKGMLDVVAVLAIPDLFHKPARVMRVQANYYNDVNGQRRSELLMSLRLPTPLPADISYGANNCYFTGSGEEGKLRVPVYEEEMKYFYSDYKDYYYLPREDMAIHKSVASYVDKEYRQPALDSNCYTRKKSSYLPQWEILFTPFFKRDYKSKELFFELTDELKTRREDFNLYAHHVLEMLLEAR